MKINVPSSLHEITLEMVQRILLIEKSGELSELARKVHSVAILTGLSTNTVAIFDLKDLDKVYAQMYALLDMGPTVPLKRFVKYQGREYAFIEDVRDMETGAFIDLDEMTKNDMYAENLHKIMAVLYRPIDRRAGDNYTLKSYVTERLRDKEERQKIFLSQMTYDVVRGAVGFFLLGGQMRLNTSKELWLRLQRERVRSTSGDGTTTSTRVQGATRQRSKMY